MRREDFVNSYHDWGELEDICRENNLCIMDDLYSQDAVEEYINDSLVDLARDNTWSDLKRILEDYEEDLGYDYYRWNDYYGRYCHVDESEIADEILEEMDYQELWDTDEEDEEDEEEYDEYQDDVDLTEDCSIMEMIEDSQSVIQRITKDELASMGEELRRIAAMIHE